AFGAGGDEPQHPLRETIEKGISAEEIGADIGFDESGIQAEEIVVRIAPCRMENEHLIAGDGVHVCCPATVRLFGVEFVEPAGLAHAGKAHDKKPRLHSAPCAV